MGQRTVSAFFPSLLLRLKLKKDLRFFLALSGSPDVARSRVDDDVTDAESDSCSQLSVAAADCTLTVGAFKLPSELPSGFSCCSSRGGDELLLGLEPPSLLDALARGEQDLVMGDDVILETSHKVLVSIQFPNFQSINPIFKVSNYTNLLVA